MSGEKLKRGETYPIADQLPVLIRGFEIPNPGDVRARWTGEKRPPRKGEWYLSGATIEAYQAHSDLDGPFHIAELVRVQARTIETVAEVLNG